MSLRQIAGKTSAIWRGNLFDRLFRVAHECAAGFYGFLIKMGADIVDRGLNRGNLGLERLQQGIHITQGGCGGRGGGGWVRVGV